MCAYHCISRVSGSGAEYTSGLRAGSVGTAARAAVGAPASHAHQRVHSAPPWRGALMNGRSEAMSYRYH
ncbi:unnamed protein product [Colias eurytheme]|nr:unnamed protein product [Colias eurytheme]